MLLDIFQQIVLQTSNSLLSGGFADLSLVDGAGLLLLAGMTYKRQFGNTKVSLKEFNQLKQDIETFQSDTDTRLKAGEAKFAETANQINDVKVTLAEINTNIKWLVQTMQSGQSKP
jgi:septal ring factor EnvC (AmiA/AmiB activator)